MEKGRNLKKEVSKTVLVYCPYPIHSPSHGNEARTRQIVDYLNGKGYRCIPFVYVVYDFIHKAEVSRSMMSQSFDEWFYYDGDTFNTSKTENLELCGITLRHDFLWLIRMINSVLFSGLRVTNLKINYLPLKVSRILYRILKSEKFDAVVTTYIWTTNIFDLCGRTTKKILDLHDIFSNHKSTSSQNAIAKEYAWLTLKSEVLLMNKADLAICIQNTESTLITSEKTKVKVITVGYAPEEKILPVCTNLTVGTVGSSNNSNNEGLRFFVDAIWPIVLSEVPMAVLLIGGKQSEVISFQHRSVKILEQIEVLEDFYKECRVVINCSLGGSGLKIKTVEGIRFGRNVVTWPSGATGVVFQQERLHIAQNPLDFASKIVNLLVNSENHWMVKSSYSQDENYLPLERYIND